MCQYPATRQHDTGIDGIVWMDKQGEAHEHTTDN